MMKHIQILIILFLSLSTSMIQAREIMAKTGEYYKGPQNLTIEVAPTAKGDKCIIKITGGEESFSNRMFFANNRLGYNNRQEYVIKHNNKDYVLIIKTPTKWQTPTVFFYPPNTTKEIHLKQINTSVNTEQLLDEWESKNKNK